MAVKDLFEYGLRGEGISGEKCLPRNVESNNGMSCRHGESRKSYGARLLTKPLRIVISRLHGRTMKRPGSYRLICLLFCVCTVLTHADSVVRSLSCPWWKTGFPIVLHHDSEPLCCHSDTCSAVGSASSLQDIDEPSRAGPQQTPCSHWCCDTFQAPVFLIGDPGLAFRLTDFSFLIEMSPSFNHSDFTRLLFRPPQA
jgi:hypothetical protein